MKKIIIIALALMFVATPVFAKKPKPTPTPTPVVEIPVGPLPSPLPSTVQYFGANGQVIKQEVVAPDGTIISSWSMPTPTPQAPAGVPVERTWLDDIQDILNSIQAKINEIVNSLK
jgi:hypothetical protein